MYFARLRNRFPTNRAAATFLSRQAVKSIIGMMKQNHAASYSPRRIWFNNCSYRITFPFFDSMPILNRSKRPTLFNSYHPVGSWILLLVLLVLAARELDKIYSRWTFNELIENPEKIPQSNADLPPEVLFAKARYLNQKGDYQQALRHYLRIETKGPPAFQINVRYNMGVIYLQQASKLWKAKGVWEYNQINTLLDLAEQYFREVLSAKPEHWQARYNLEYALRIRPPAKEQEKADWQGHKSSVHAIMPGIPEGGP